MKIRIGITKPGLMRRFRTCLLDLERGLAGWTPGIAATPGSTGFGSRRPAWLDPSALVGAHSGR
ncbi:MAG: hypothetical protein WBM50_20425, partial [Acidimicrobiales bacterium]